MKKELFISSEIQDIVTALTVSFAINSIDEASGVSTINSETVTIFDNLDKIMLLQDGMIVTLDDINYQVSNVINQPATKSFDITATGLVATEWNVAANYKPGTRKEINQTLDQESGSFDRFPLIWIMLPTSEDYNQEVLDFIADLVLVFAHKANRTDRLQKRIDDNFDPVIQPLFRLFLLWLQSSNFNYMLEFFGHDKAIDYDKQNFAFYGNTDKTKDVITTISTDAIEVSMILNFKKQY